MSHAISRLFVAATVVAGLTGCIGYTCNCGDVGEVQTGLRVGADVPADDPVDDWTQIDVEIGEDEVIIDYVDGDGQVWQVRYGVRT